MLQSTCIQFDRLRIKQGTQQMGYTLGIGYAELHLAAGATDGILFMSQWLSCFVIEEYEPVVELTADDSCFG